MIGRMPDRPFGEGEAGAELADRRVDVDQLLELGAQRGVGHVNPSHVIPGPSEARSPESITTRIWQ